MTNAQRIEAAFEKLALTDPVNNPGAWERYMVELGRAIESLRAESPAAGPETTILDRWNYSGLPSVDTFNHAVDVANTLHAENQRLRAQLAALESLRDARPGCVRCGRPLPKVAAPNEAMCAHCHREQVLGQQFPRPQLAAQPAAGPGLVELGVLVARLKNAELDCADYRKRGIVSAAHDAAAAHVNELYRAVLAFPLAALGTPDGSSATETER